MERTSCEQIVSRAFERPASRTQRIRSELNLMPTVLRIGRYRFFFYSNEGSEPRHIHVEAGEDEAKFWVLPVSLAANHGFQARELNEIELMVREHEQEIVEAWDDYFGRG